eukprot:CAMPEP_0118700738 /NCGR_PEP_ID=MMETSP0800-20121206/16774_1 /TAXON_ID=210618 ORGANISM="Striatella unipunctata, Strain CCMP2910" /NCGR_SAMPLE_ID=MMETSP0800 /ASSEMBLY_ACC=CAM_ASM_000638 /LENGTH=204 /DNA_ID=CAMNT_0006601405 /DNA_START=54 /DNA_END=668 /DNA_ORIENTATION=-
MYFFKISLLAFSTLFLGAFATQIPLEERDDAEFIKSFAHEAARKLLIASQEPEYEHLFYDEDVLEQRELLRKNKKKDTSTTPPATTTTTTTTTTDATNNPGEVFGLGLNKENLQGFNPCKMFNDLTAAPIVAVLLTSFPQFCPYQPIDGCTFEGAMSQSEQVCGMLFNIVDVLASVIKGEDLQCSAACTTFYGVFCANCPKATA